MKNKKLSILLKIALLILISIVVGTLLMVVVYSIPLNLLIDHAKDSINIYSENIIKQWAGYTRYSHISNTTDSVMINAAICRPYDSVIENALLNPHYTDFIESFSSTSVGIEDFPRYWHGYLVYIIPCLLVTNAGGIRTIMMIVQYLLTIVLVYELAKKNKMYMFIYAIAALFINPVTAAISFQDADIYIIMMVFTIFILKKNDWLKQNNRYLLLFTLNGIVVSFIDYLTYPLVAWGIPLATVILINKGDLKKNLINVVSCSLCWIAGYVGMWAGKWVVASILTNTNVIADAINQVAFRTVGDSYSFVATIKQIWESVNDVPMLSLYCLAIAIIIIYAFKNKLKISMNKSYLLEVMPYIIIALGPIVWFFVIRNHSYVHPWFEYRELAVTIYCILLVFFKSFK